MILLLGKEYAVNLAVGNVDPKMKTSIANNVPLSAQVKCVSTVAFSLKRKSYASLQLFKVKQTYVYIWQKKETICGPLSWCLVCVLK